MGITRNYQPKKDNPYRLPHNVYMQCLYAVRDYERIKSARQDILYASPCSDGQPRGSETSDTTAAKAVKMEALSKQCEDVEQALIQIPSEYSRGIMNSILYGARYPNDAGEATYRRWRYKFMFCVAVNKKLM